MGPRAVRHRVVLVISLGIIALVAIPLSEVWGRNQQALAVLRSLGASPSSLWLGLYQDTPPQPKAALPAPGGSPLWRGRVALLAGDASSARSAFAEVEPSSPLRFIGLGAAAALEGKHAEAGDAWEQGQAVGLLWARVRWFQQSGQRTLALADLDRLARLLPNDPTVPAEVGGALEGEGRHLEAAESFLRADALEQRHRFWRWQAARSFLMAGAYEKAETLLASAPASDTYAQMLLGDLYLSTNRPSMAAKSYQLALENGVHDPVYCALRLADAYAALGEVDREAAARRLAMNLRSGERR